MTCDYQVSSVMEVNPSLKKRKELEMIIAVGFWIMKFNAKDYFSLTEQMRWVEDLAVIIEANVPVNLVMNYARLKNAALAEADFQEVLIPGMAETVMAREMKKLHALIWEDSGENMSPSRFRSLERYMMMCHIAEQWLLCETAGYRTIGQKKILDKNVEVRNDRLQTFYHQNGHNILGKFVESWWGTGSEREYWPTEERDEEKDDENDDEKGLHLRLMDWWRVK